MMPARYGRPSAVSGTSRYPTPNAASEPSHAVLAPITEASVSYGAPVAASRVSPGRSTPNSAIVIA